MICVNKVDLAEDVTACRMRMQPYRALGLRTVYTSALSGYGIDELRNALANKTTVVAGLSGVGKSSLLARVQPGLALRVGDVNARQHLGRHTTSQATMIPLGDGGFVVDTPGIKEFGLGGLNRSDLAAFYPELATLGQACRFGDCLHLDEPGCAVQGAVRAGKLGTAV